MAYEKEKHDIGILDPTGSGVINEFMLAQDKNGVPLYQTFDDEYIESVSRGESRPEKELPPIMQDDWRSGFGLDDYDDDDPKRYYSSWGVDLRHRGMAILSPAKTEVSFASADYIDPTNYEDPNTGWNDEAKAYDNDTGTFAYTDSIGTNSWSEYVYYYVRFCDITKIRYWVDRTDALVNKLQIDYFSASAWHTGVNETSITTGEYVEENITATAVKQLRVRFYNDHDSGVYRGRLHELDVYGSEALDITDFAEFNSELYVANGNSLYKLNGAGNGWTHVGDLPNLITDLEPFTDNNLYIALGNANKYWYMNTSESLTESTVTNGEADFLETVHSATPTMWKANIPRELRSSTNPANGGSWSGTTNVDTSTYDILKLLSSEGTLYIKKEDRTFYLDESGNVQVLIEGTKHLAEDTSSKCGCIWQGKAYIGCGASSLVEYDSGTITWRSPSKHCVSLSDFSGEVQAVVGDEEWLYTMTQGNQVVWIQAGRLETIDGTTGWVWHNIMNMPIAGCETASISSVYQKRLWVASNTNDYLYYIPLPADYGDVVNDANRNFKSVGYFYTPRLYGGYKGDVKAFLKLRIELGHDYDENIGVNAYYKRPGSTNWTPIGNFRGSTSSPTQEICLPLDTDYGCKPSTYWIQFLFILVGDTTKTSILKSYDCRAILYPTKRRITQCVVRCADDIMDKQGNKLQLSAAEIQDKLIAVADAQWPVTFYDIWGELKYANVITSKPFSRVIKWSKGRSIEEHYYLNLQEVDLS